MEVIRVKLPAGGVWSRESGHPSICSRLDVTTVM